jgi:putative addiction module component
VRGLIETYADDVSLFTPKSCVEAVREGVSAGRLTIAKEFDIWLWVLSIWLASRYASAMTALAIEQMSWDEKLRTMEELWASLSREESRLESPLWHEQALKETAARYEAGQEQPIDWDSAKRQLRKRGE